MSVNKDSTPVTKKGGLQKSHTIASSTPPSPRGGGYGAAAHGRGAEAPCPQAPAHRRPYGLGFDEHELG